MYEFFLSSFACILFFLVLSFSHSFAIVCMMTGNTLEKGVRPLINNHGLVLVLVKYLLKVAKDERFMNGKVKNLALFLRKLFEENGVPFEFSCMKAIFPDETDTALSMLGMREVCKLGKPSGPLQHFRETIFPMIIAGEWDFQLNPDEEEAILNVLDLKIDNGKIIDLKTNEQLKTRNEKLKERNDDPEFKAREQTTEYKATRKKYRDDPENKEKKKKYRDDPENKEKAKKYRDDPENKEKARAREQTTEYKATRKKYRDDPENKEKRKEYRDDPENKLKRKERDQKPENKLKRKEYKKRRKIEHIKQQLKFPPPLGFNAPCATCPREKSRGWMRAIKAHKLLSKKFDEKGLIGYLPLDKSYNILNIKKRAAKGEGCPKLNQNDVFCLGCWTTTQVEADNKIAKVLAERNKNEQLMK